MTLKIQLVPAGDESLEAEARELLRYLCSKEPIVECLDDSGNAQRGVEWTVLAGLVLAAPGALTALFELAERLSQGRGRAEARHRIEPMLNRAQAARRSGRQVTLTVDELTLDLGRASVDDVLDALATAGVSARHGNR